MVSCQSGSPCTGLWCTATSSGRSPARRAARLSKSS
ncbi:Uncharacterised protein [Bordetella pertussis]|nr:Uncharacterised protein [Bordetella pertussis]